ncbi:alpha/beta hydrolase [Ruegeria jejuensis]|uniref:alpha/beta hydrolase n=1 Tax=Ruegeria jejuensis TaxID=3233338 RepID=UPI00355AF11A
MAGGKYNYPMKGDEPDYPPLVLADNVERHTVTVWSDGIALDADVYRPKGLAADAKVPAIVMSHGWGGTKRTAERYGGLFAANGMIAISFSQTGWGDSAGRIQVVGDAPEFDENGEATVKIKETRQFVDPTEWVRNYVSAIDYIVGEPNVDVNRIGAWGTSFGGGVAAYVAATDPRIKAMAVQVSAMLSLQGPMLQHATGRATAIARGDIDPLPAGLDKMPNLTGSVNFGKALRYDVIAAAENLNVPSLIMDAQNEEMFPTAENGGRVAEMLREKGVEVRYELIDGIDHYGIYFDGYEHGSKMAVEWFTKYL